ncbi:MAG: NUDIX domain-containing protein [Candidatus Nanohalobium sp.]
MNVLKLKSWIVWRGKDIGMRLAGKLLYPRNSAAAVVLKNGKVLGIDVGSYMMLPGGGLDYGESFREAAGREVMEETGLEVEIGEKLFEGVNSVGGVEKIFQASVVGGELDGNWEGEPIWLEREEAKRKRWRHDRDMEELLEKSGI